MQICHSCDPSAQPVFKNADSELYLIANRDLKAGDEITVSYVDTTVHEGESVADARRRRRFELARGWRFPCPCERCVKEGTGAVEEGPTQDGSKVDDAQRRMDEKEMESGDP